MAIYRITNKVRVDDTNDTLENNGWYWYGSLTSAQITALTGVVTGSIVNNSTTGQMQRYNGSSWDILSTSTSFNTGFVTSGRIATANINTNVLTTLVSVVVPAGFSSSQFIANFNGYILHSNNDVNVSFVFALNGANVTNGILIESGHTSRTRTVGIQEAFTVSTGDTISVKWATDSNTATINNYSLYIKR